VATLRPAPAARVVYVDRPVPLPTPSAAVPSAPPPPAPADSAASPRPAPDAHPAPSALGSGEASPAERLLIDDARTKLTSGDPTAALARLQEHAHRFPGGRLIEEREALAIEALVQSGQYDAARARAAKFHARWPGSLFLPAVDTTIQSIP
jgi:TolA-binding protein